VDDFGLRSGPEQETQRRVLQAIRGLQVVELPRQEQRTNRHRRHEDGGPTIPVPAAVFRRTLRFVSCE
jgi:hypothetical protein